MRHPPAAVAAAGALLAFAPSAAADVPGAAQIGALQEIKQSLSAVERKLDSRLAVTLRRRANPVATARLPRVTTGVTVSRSGTTVVDVRATKVTAELLDRLRALGARIRRVSPRLASIRAEMPLTALRGAASRGDVRRIEVAVGAITARYGEPRAPESKDARAARLDRALQAALADRGRGDVVSEGDRVQAVDTARDATGVKGVGVKACVLSDGVDSLESLQAAGELPAVDVLPGQEGFGDEGAAMLEILHDLAPNARLGFATAFESDASFADNIRALRFQAGCDVIVDDVLYFNETPFQDGPIAQSVNAVTADGALFFSSAGNEGNTIDGTSGTYEGDFAHSGGVIGKFGGVAHDFDPGPGVQLFEPLSGGSSGNVPVTLFWADPLGRAADDYDLYLLDDDGNVIAFSQDVQDGDDDPFEILGTPGVGGARLRLAVVKFSGADRYLQLSALGGRFTDSPDGLVARVTPGAIRGHAAAAQAFATAAAPAAAPLAEPLEPGDPPNPPGPFPYPFSEAQLPEPFTSDGPRRIFFHPDGTPITPGNLSSTGGEVRRKPDITAADGVSVATPGFAPFFGTSAAAPHAAAIAAMVLSGNPGATREDVRQAFDNTAIEITPPGVDERTGHGIVRADLVLADSGATPQPLVEAGTLSVAPLDGDGDAYLEPGETATLTVPVVNTGDGTATGVSVRVSSAEPGVAVSPRTRSYGDVPAGATVARDFTLSLPEDHPLGRPVKLSLRITFAGVLSPSAGTHTLATGQPAAEPTTFSYTGPPVPIPDDSDAGAAVTIPVSGIGYAAKLTFSIDGEDCTDVEGATSVGLEHPFVGDLVGTLTSPGGRTVTLFQRAGGGANNFCQTVFDDDAERPFDAVSSDDAPFTGSWRPREPLAALLAAPVDGTWTFRALDVAARDVGSIRAVSLHITGFVAEPPAAAAAGQVASPRHQEYGRH